MRDIYRAKVEAFNCSQCNYSAKTRIAHSGSKGFRVVKARPLTESLSNNACFESFNRSICIVFYFKHPFGSNCFLLLWQILYCPGPILHVGLDFLQTSLLPLLCIRTIHCLSPCCWFHLSNNIGRSEERRVGEE